MGEPRTAAVCVVASPQEALGYESRGRDAKRREMAAMEEKALWWYTSANGKKERQYRGTLKRNKEAIYRKGEGRIEWHGVDCQSSMRDQNRPGFLASCLCAASWQFHCKSRLSAIFNLYREFITEGIAARTRFVYDQISIRTEICNFCYFFFKANLRHMYTAFHWYHVRQKNKNLYVVLYHATFLSDRIS